MIGRLPLEIMTGFIQRHRRMTAHEAFDLADRAFVFASVHLREAARERAICDYINTTTLCVASQLGPIARNGIALLPFWSLSTVGSRSLTCPIRVSKRGAI